MSDNVNPRIGVLEEPSYWLEKINADVYNMLLDYMSKNNIKRQKDIATILEISPSRVSQIINEIFLI